MKSLILLEKTIAIKSYRLLSLIISLFVVSSISFIIYYLLEGKEIMSSIDILFSLNLQILFPVIFSSYIIASFLSDFKNGNKYLLQFSPIKKERIFMSKIIVNMGSIFLVYMLLVNIYLAFTLIYHNQDYAFIGFLKFSVFEVFMRTNMILLCTYFYIISFALISIIFTLLLPKFSTSILLIVFISITHTIFPLPDYLSKYLFLSSYNIYSAIQLVEFPMGRVIEATLVNIINAILLIILSLKIYTKKFSIRNGEYE